MSRINCSMCNAGVLRYTKLRFLFLTPWYEGSIMVTGLRKNFCDSDSVYLYDTTSPLNLQTDYKAFEAFQRMDEHISAIDQRTPGPQRLSNGSRNVGGKVGGSVRGNSGGNAGGNAGGNNGGNIAPKVRGCLSEVQKMEQELWNLTVKGDDIVGYTDRTSRDIQRNVTSFKPTTTHEAIRMAHNLMDQVVRVKATRGGDGNKQNWEDHQSNNINCNNNHHHQQNRRQEAVRAYAATPNKGKVCWKTYIL
ncbi:hypothetical protein Tco_1301143 [Tanacetum coccineum]